MHPLFLPQRREGPYRPRGWSSPAGCRPSSTASTISGASSVRRTTRLTYEGFDHFGGREYPRRWRSRCFPAVCASGRRGQAPGEKGVVEARPISGPGGAPSGVTTCLRPPRRRSVSETLIVIVVPSLLSCSVAALPRMAAPSHAALRTNRPRRLDIRDERLQCWSSIRRLAALPVLAFITDKAGEPFGPESDGCACRADIDPLHKGAGCGPARPGTVHPRAGRSRSARATIKVRGQRQSG